MSEKFKNPTSAPLLIAGGGIGGLTAALSLARAGFKVEVFEQAQALSEIGAGLQLSPNATRVLESLGLLDHLTTAVGMPEALRVYSATSGHRLTKMPLGSSAQRRWGAPYYVAHRSDLQQALYDACNMQDGVDVHFDCVVQNYTLKDGVEIDYKQGGEIKKKQGFALIGADGLWSKVREQLLEDGGPRATGYVAYRAMIPVEALPSKLYGSSSTLWLGPDLHIVHYPLRGHALVNIVAIVRENFAEKTWGADAKPDALFNAAQRYAPVLRDLLHAPKEWSRWPLYDRPIDERDWPRQPVTLLGDAAHPMLPFLAQGAAQAIEDTAILTESLIELPQQPVYAFAEYRARRAPHIARLQREAEWNGAMFHWDGLKARARDFALHLISGERLMQRYDWVYSGP